MPKKTEEENSLHLVKSSSENAKDKQKFKARPSWAEPIIDQNGNTKGWRATKSFGTDYFRRKLYVFCR